MDHAIPVGSRFDVQSAKFIPTAPIKFSLDLLLWTLAAPLAFLLALEDQFLQFLPEITIYTLLSILVKALALYANSLHRQAWQKVGTRDLYKLVRAVATTIPPLLALIFVWSPSVHVPRSVPLLDGLLALFALAGIRLGVRLLNEHVGTQEARRIVGEPARRVLIIGAGEAGTMIAREMIRHPQAGLEPIGYLDDDPCKSKQFFFGVPVLGTVDELPAVVVRSRADEVLIAMPSLSGDVIRRVVELAREAKVRHRIMPGVYDILSEKVSISLIREVDVEDLLRRDPIRLDMQEIAAYLEGRTVLVTGASGSIGSELVRQIAPFNPREIVILDREENNLYLFERELKATFPDLHILTVVADVRRYQKLDLTFAVYQPDVVFHAAAYKHVPVMETNPSEAILNNVGGTRNLLLAAEKYGVQRFVNISTDKAVRPTSIMGASKRVAEYLVEEAAARSTGDGCFVSVRFGNVLGSRGSVVPIFKEQIAQGGPVTVTDPEMTRYFMSIPEAAQLVLQAAGLGQNGAVYVLDMGDPVRIQDLAHDLIKLSGLEPNLDIPVDVVGARPGEKMYEELLTAEEGTSATRHEKIFCARKNGGPGEEFRELLDELFRAAAFCDDDCLRDILKELIPTYQPQTNGYVNVVSFTHQRDLVAEY